MYDLIFFVDPCPAMPIVNPPALNLNVSCPSHLNITVFGAIPYSVTFSGPIDPNKALFLNSLLSSHASGSSTDYENLCNCLRGGGRVQITLHCDPLGGFLVVRSVTCHQVQQVPLSAAVMDIHAITRRIEQDVSVTVINDLNQLKAQMAEVLARLPPLVGSGLHHPISEFAHTGGDAVDERERTSYGSDKEAS